VIPEVVFDEFLLLFTSLSVSSGFSRMLQYAVCFAVPTLVRFVPARLACVSVPDHAAAPVGVGVGGLVDAKRGP
jgi:hypothetical protein